MFERRLYFHIDWLLLGAVLLLAGIGVAMIYSATYQQSATGGRASSLPVTQLYALAIGLVALVICLAVDYRVFAENSLFLYGGLVLLLVFVLLKGSTQMGAQRWIPIGPFHLQPSEFGRIVVALVLAMFFAENRRGAKNTGDLIIGGIMCAIPLLLIAKQPDLGTAVTLMPVFVGIAFLAGLRLRLLGVLALAAVLIAPVAWKFALKDYQRQRILTFHGSGAGSARRRLPDDPGPRDRRLGRSHGQGLAAGHAGADTSSCPSRTTTSSSRFWRRNRASSGCSAPSGSISSSSFRISRVGPPCQGPTRLVSGGRHHFGVCVPGDLQRDDVGRPRAVKGITLPLMSYGGSSLIATLAGFGLILNVRMRRFTN
jgi:rod shape determining protein RodA